MIVEFCRLYADDMTFSEQNPMIKEMMPFKELYDKSVELGDRICGGLYRIYDLKSPFYAAIDDEQERIKDVNVSFMEDENFPWQDYNKYIITYKDKCRTELQKRLDSMRSELSEREIFYRSLSYEDPEELLMKETLRKSQKDFLLEYQELEELAKEEVSENVSYASYIKSYIERKSSEMKKEQKKKGLID